MYTTFAGPSTFGQTSSNYTLQQVTSQVTQMQSLMNQAASVPSAASAVAQAQAWLAGGGGTSTPAGSGPTNLAWYGTNGTGYHVPFTGQNYLNAAYTNASAINSTLQQALAAAQAASQPAPTLAISSAMQASGITAPMMQATSGTIPDGTPCTDPSGNAGTTTGGICQASSNNNMILLAVLAIAGVAGLMFMLKKKKPQPMGYPYPQYPQQYPPQYPPAQRKRRKRKR